MGFNTNHQINFRNVNVETAGIYNVEFHYFTTALRKIRARFRGDLHGGAQRHLLRRLDPADAAGDIALEGLPNRAVALYFMISEEDVQLALRDEPFGQRHFIVQDPNGVLIDVIQPIPPSEDFLRQYAAGAAAR